MLAGVFCIDKKRELMMAYSLRESAQFVSDLQNLDPVIRKRANKSLKQLESDPYYPGLASHPQDSIRGRKAMRSRVNDNFRILWEWGNGGVINLWRVAKHDVIDAMYTLPTEAGANWRFIVRNKADGRSALQHDWREDLRRPHPFRNVPENHLRLFGVPDEHIGAVKALLDAEELWDMPIAENVQYTLYDVLSQAEDWTADALLDTGQLLYRATADQLEGYCEGKIKRLLLNLNDEQERYVTINASGPVLIKGVAGSGKTTIGLYRAHYLAKHIEARRRMFGDAASILLLTYTETLTKALQQLYRELYGDMTHSIAVQSCKGWMLEQLRSHGVHLSEAKREERAQIVDTARKTVARQYPHDSVVNARPVAYLLDEFDQVIRARSVTSMRQYQSIRRVGRGMGLDRARHRPIVWQIYELYQQGLDARNLFDWADLARLVQIHCRPLPKYDVVLVDEAQDLPPSDLHLLSRLLPDYSDYRSLTLLADPAQSIYYRGIPWKEAGISIQGRTRILAKNYRNTRQILLAAEHIVEGCQDLKDEQEYIPAKSANRPGAKPFVASYASAAKSNQFLASEIIKLCQSGRYRPGDIAVISRRKRLLTSYIEGFLRSRNILCRFHRDKDFHVLENEVKLITMHSAKGLEFPVVFIIGLDDDYVPDIRVDSDTKAEDELQERKLFYVSMTRAAERLYLLHPKRNRSRFLHDLDPATVTRKEC